MFLIMGMKVKLKALDTGSFHCPRCATHRGYTRLQARRWFTIFFVPVIPLGTVGTVVRCDHCGGQFAEAVLSAPTSIGRADAVTAAMRAVMAALIALAADDAATVAAAMKAMRIWGMPGYGDTDLVWDRQARTADRARELATAAGGGLDPVRREQFMVTALDVARADGDATAAEHAYVRDVGTWLGLTPANIDGVLAHSGAGPRP